jgi:hypothetical protein
VFDFFVLVIELMAFINFDAVFECGHTVYGSNSGAVLFESRGCVFWLLCVVSCGLMRWGAVLLVVSGAATLVPARIGI